MSYILITKRDCPFCVSAVDLLQENELEHEISDLQDFPEALDSIKRVFNWATVPMVLLRKNDQTNQTDAFELIGGYDDLREHLKREDSVG